MSSLFHSSMLFNSIGRSVDCRYSFLPLRKKNFSLIARIVESCEYKMDQNIAPRRP